MRSIITTLTACSLVLMAGCDQAGAAPSGSPDPAASQAAIGSSAALIGTWDYVFDEEGGDAVLDEFRREGLVDSADQVAVRIGFDDETWWQGFVFDDELFLLHGVPEGDGGSFSLVSDEPRMELIGAHGQARIVLEWTIDGDELTLTAVEECAISGTDVTCTTDRSQMDPVGLSVMEHTFTRSGDDSSY